MINYLKLKNYKGIKEAKLENLGHINIICGKNNSGKSSILEAINTNDCCKLGRKFEENDIDEWLSFGKSVIRGYVDPSPHTYLAWYEEFIKKQIDTIFYEDEIEDKKKYFLDNRTDYLKHFGNDGALFNFSIPILNFIKNIKDKFLPIIIPPKRILKVTTDIASDRTVTPNGDGVLNRLFFLKNQPLHSEEYAVYQKIYNTFYQVTDGYFF